MCVCVRSCNGTPCRSVACRCWPLKVTAGRSARLPGMFGANLFVVMEPQLMDVSRSKCIPAGTRHQICLSFITANESESRHMYTPIQALMYFKNSILLFKLCLLKWEIISRPRNDPLLSSAFSLFLVLLLSSSLFPC